MNRTRRICALCLCLAALAPSVLRAQEAAPAEKAERDYTRGWYVGAQGGVPFGVSGFTAFGADKTRAGWNVGLHGGYRFNPLLSLEAQARFGGLGLGNQSCCTEAGYWLGADGLRYFAPVSGMEGWEYADLMGKVTTQHYGVQLNVNLLGFFNATKESRWRLEVSPLLAAVGTKASIRTLSGDAEIMDSESRWHLGAGGNLQASYAVTKNLNIGIYSGITYLTGKSMDGLPESVHRNNYIWESGLRIGWAFGGKSRKAKAAAITPATPVQTVPAEQPKPAETVQPEQKPVTETIVPAEKPDTVAVQPADKAEITLVDKEGKAIDTNRFPTIYFSFNSVWIEPDERAKVSRIADTMKANPGLRIRITGWCDEIGGEEVNKRVSLQRAEAVKNGLVKRLVAAERIETVGGGIARDAKSAEEARNASTIEVIK